MSLTPDDIHKYFKIKRTQVEMMVDRGCLIPENEIVMFIENPDAQKPTPKLYGDFIKAYTHSSNGIFSRQLMNNNYENEKGELTHVFFAPQTTKDRQGIASVNGFITNLTELGAEHGIIITEETFTSDARKALDILTSPTIQIYYDYQLYTNPTRHVLVPRHTKLTEEERLNFFEKSRIKPNQLITFSLDDPIVSYYGWSAGDLIRIDRINLATNKTMVKASLSYRLVGRNRLEQLKAIARKAKVVSKPGENDDDD